MVTPNPDPNKIDRHARANLRALQIRDLVTGEVLTRVGHTAHEILGSREPSGKRRFVLVGNEPAGWKPPRKKASPPAAAFESPQPDEVDDEEEQILAEDEPEQFESPEDAETGSETAPETGTTTEVNTDGKESGQTSQKPKGQRRNARRPKGTEGPQG